jgi:lipoate---protein ligase
MKWRVIGLETADAFTNMAIDNVIVEAVESGKSLPTIRFYKWNPEAVSIGNDQAETDIDLGYCRLNNIDVVRRLTLRSGVYHPVQDFTYSVIMPLTERPYHKQVFKIKKDVNAWVVNAFLSMGINAYLHGKNNDVMVENKKISGNTCVATGTIPAAATVFLQQGTFIYSLNHEIMSRIFMASADVIKGKVTSISEHANLSEKLVYECIKKGFLEGKEYEAGGLSGDELKRLHEIVDGYKDISISRYNKKALGACYLHIG